MSSNKKDLENQHVDESVDNSIFVMGKEEIRYGEKESDVDKKTIQQWIVQTIEQNQGANEVKVEEQETSKGKKRKLSTVKLKVDIDTLAIEGLELNLEVLLMSVQKLKSKLDDESKKIEVLQHVVHVLQGYKDTRTQAVENLFDGEEKVKFVNTMLEGERLLIEMLTRLERRL